MKHPRLLLLPGMRCSARIMQTAILLSLASFISLTSAQGLLDSIPKCYQDCLVQSGDYTCNGLDIKCMCRLSGGNFLTDVITCIRRDCDNNLDLSQLAGPIMLACASVGAPLDASVLDNAESIEASLAATTKTVTATWTGVRTATSTFASAGTMYVVVVPLTASKGRSGIQTATGSIRTIAAASITGDGQGLSVTSRSDEAGSSSSSRTGSGSTSTAVVTAILSVTTETATPSETATATVTAAGVASNNGDGGGDDRPSRQTGDGTPYVPTSSDGGMSLNMNTNQQNQHKWWGIGVCVILAIGGFAWR